MKPVVRKEIHLTEEVIQKLQKLADQKGRKLKPFMESILEKKSETVKNK